MSDPFKAACGLLAGIKAKHPDIAHAFGSDAGARLMRRDSDLAERIMLEVLQATGAVPLCIHDGFVVERKHEGRLKQAMENAFPCGTTTTKIPCGTTPEFRDILSSTVSTASAKSAPQYGRESAPGGWGRMGGWWPEPYGAWVVKPEAKWS